MGIESHKAKTQFGIRELGVLDGPPLRGADTIVQTVVELLGVRRAAFLVFDDTAACLRARTTSDAVRVLDDFPLTNSLSAIVRDEDRPVSVRATALDSPDAPEIRYLDAAAYLGTPVYGPDRDAIGVLAATHSAPREWNMAALKKMENLAYLVSQEIMLRASFETLRIMAAERHPHFS